MDLVKPATTLRMIAVAMLMLVLLAVSQPTLAAPPVGLFSDATSRADANVRSYPAAVVMRSRPVNVAFDMLPAASGAKGDSLPLNLFADASYTAVMDRIDTSAQGSVWVGHVEGVAMSNVTLSTVGNVMAGVVFLPDAVYAVRYSGNGVHTVYQISQGAFPPEGEPNGGHADTPNAAPRLPLATNRLFLPFLLKNFNPTTGSGPQIDVLVVYTPSAVTLAGGASAMAALIGGAESITNTSYANSGVAQRVKVVGSALVNYAEDGDMGIDLDNLTGAVGALSVVPGLRTQYKADLVDLLVGYPSPPYCGIAWLNSTVSTAFSVVEQSCAVDNLSWPHELGHNMGARHDWYMDAANTYAKGYINTASRWRTIMAYNNQCSALGFNCARIPYWSNPAITYGGAAMGVPDGTNRTCTAGNAFNPPCDADDHKMLNNTAATIAAFK